MTNKELKKFGGTITNWTIHNFTLDETTLKAYNDAGLLPQVMTGVVVDDPLGRWEVGWSMRSSLIISVDRENGIIETQNTIYKVEVEKELPDEDIGNLAASIYF